MKYLNVGQIITIDVPLGFDWPWARAMQMRVTCNSSHQKAFPIESPYTWIRATPAEEVAEIRELDVRIDWIQNLDAVTAND